MLIFEPFANTLRWFDAQDKSLSTGELNLTNGVASCLSTFENLAAASMLAFVLPNGGTLIQQTRTTLIPAVLDQVEQCIALAPIDNRLIYEAALFCSQQYPNIPQNLLCETAFFHSLPIVSSAYALPYTYFQQGIRRFGGDGLCHQQTWHAAHPYYGHNARVISIHLCDHTNIAAIHGGQPIETSLGFSSLEGIPSLHGCGDIDPTAVLVLHQDGQSIDEIRTILTHNSGLSALAQRPISFSDLLNNTDADLNTPALILQNRTAEYTGAAAAALGGVDALIFTCEDLPQAAPFIRTLCQQLALLKIDLAAQAQQNGNNWLFTQGGPIAVVGLQRNRIDILRSAML